MCRKITGKTKTTREKKSSMMKLFTNVKGTRKRSRFSKGRKLLIAALALMVVLAGSLAAVAAVNADAVHPFVAQVQSFFTGNQDSVTPADRPLSTEEGIAYLSSSGAEVTQVATGDRHSLALLSDGTIWAWGESVNGQLGLGDQVERHVPVQIQHAGVPTVWRSVYSGALFSGAIAEDGTLWMWGLNSGTNNNGPLGLGHSGGNSLIPAQVYHPNLGIPVYWKTLSLGQGNAFGIAEDNTLWSWGSSGQVAGLTANGVVHNANVPIEVAAQWAPHPDPDWPDVPSQWKDVSVNQSHTLAIDYNNRIWAWGSPADGRLGFGPNNLHTGRPRILANYLLGAPTLDVGTPHAGVPTEWRSVSAGAAFSLAIDMDGHLWSWGHNNHGQLGLNSALTSVRVPTRVQRADIPDTWKEANAGWISASAIAEDDSSLWVWGNGGGGRLGFGDDTDARRFPVQMQGPGIPAEWRTAQTGTWTQNAHTLAVAEDGSLWTWGGNNRGRLGKGVSSGANTHVASTGDTFRGLYLNGVEESDPVLANEGSDNWIPWRVAGHPIPSWGSAPWPNGTPLGRSNWTPPSDATIPAAGASNISGQNTEYLVIFFDRLMADFAYSTSPGIVTLSQGAISRSAAASGFVDTFTGTSMHEYSWNFTTSTDGDVTVNMPLGRMINTQADFDALDITHPAGPFDHPNRGIQSVFIVPLIFDDDGPGDDEDLFTKILEMPTGTTIPNATFAFEFTAVQVLGISTSSVIDSVPVANVPTISPNPTITVNPATADTPDPPGTVTTVTGTLDLRTLLETALATANPGVYVWNIHEVRYSSGTTSPSYMIYDEARFQVRAWVGNSGDISLLHIFELNYDEGSWVAGNKIDYIEFLNTYYINTDLEVGKTIPVTPENELASRNTLFDFTVTLTAHELVSLPNPLTATIYHGATEVVRPVTIIVTPATSTAPETATLTFQLRDGERLSIPGLPAGTIFSAVEAQHPDFAPSVSVVIGGTTVHTDSEGMNTALNTGNHTLVASGRNAADFENSTVDVTLAGLMVNSGYGILIALAIAVLAVLAAFAVKRRRAIESLFVI